MRLTLEPLREQPSCLRPVRGKLARGDMANAEPAAEIDDPSHRDTDERRDRAVRASRAEERGLERRVHTVEGRVVPVEAAAGLRRLRQERRSTVRVSASRSSAGHWSAPARRPPPPARSSSASAGWASASAENRPARASRKGFTSGRYS